MSVPVVVQSGTAAFGFGILNFTFTPTAGSVLLLAVYRRDGGPGACSAVTAGWSVLAENVGGGSFSDTVVVFGKVADGTETSVNVTIPSNPSSGLSYHVIEVAGHTLPVEDSASNSSSGTTLTSGSVDATDDALVMGFFAGYTGSATYSGSGSWTLLQQLTGISSHPVGGAVYQEILLAGAYNPSMTSAGSIDYRGISISLPVSPFTADFSGTPTTGSRPLAVTFTDESYGGGVGAATSWQWDFGDGSTSTEQNPIHVYLFPGSYTVTLIASDGTDTDTETKTAYIVVSETDAPDPTDSAEPGVWIDWNDDGFGIVGASTDGELARMMPEGDAVISDDITLDVISVTGSDGGQYDTASGASPGSFTIIVRNDTGKYTPRNTGSTYYGVLKPGKRVWIGATSGGNTYGTIAGFIKDIVPLPRIGQCQIICEDPIAKWQKTPVAVIFGEHRTAAEYRRLILTALGLPAYRQAISAEPDILPVSGAQDNNGIRALEAINQAVGTRHWIQAANDKDDHFFYMTAGRNDNLGNETAIVTLTDDDITDISGLRTTLDTMYNVQRVTPTLSRTFDDLGEVWVLDDVPMALDTTESRAVYADLGTWTKDLVVAVTSTGGTVTSVVENYGNSAKITLTTSGTPAVVTKMVLSGRPNGFSYGRDAVARATSSINTYGEREGQSISTDLLSGLSQAQGVSEAMAFRTREPRDRPVIQMKNRFDKTLLIHIGDVIGVTQAEMHLSGFKLEVIGRRFNIDKANKLWAFDYTTLETPIQTDYDFFILDQSVLDGPDVLGF